MASIPHSHTKNQLLRGRWYGWIFWSVVAFFYLYEFFIRVTPNVILPELANDLGGTPGSIATAMSAYLWVYAPMQLVVGILLDKWGSKYIVSTAAMICAAGCILFSQSDSLVTAGFGRGLIGMGSAFAFVGAIYVATVWFPPKQLGLIAGITTSVGMIGEVIGQVPVADLVDTFSWPKVVFASGLVGLLIGIVMLLVIPRRPSWFKDRFKHDQEIQVSLLKSLGLILKNPQIWIVGCISAILYLPLSVIAALWGTSYLGKTMDLDISDASLCMSMLAVGWLIGCPIVGKLSDISQNRRIPLLLGSIGGFITMGLFLMAQNMNLTSMMILTFVMGLVTSTQTLAFAVSIELSPRALAATAISICNFLTMLIAAALQNAIGWILNWRIDSNMKHGDYIGPLTTHPLTHAVHEVQNSSKGVYANVSVSDFTWAIAVIPVLFLVAIVLCFFLKETHARKVSEVDPD